MSIEPSILDPGVARRPAVVRRGPVETAGSVEAALVRRLEGAGRTAIAFAPFRFDVMGGVGEYAGGACLNWPIADGIVLAARGRDDGQAAVTVLSPDGQQVRFTVTTPCTGLPGAGDDPGNGSPGAAPRSDPSAAEGLARAAGMAVRETIGKGRSARTRGVSVVLAPSRETQSDLGQACAAAAAALSALGRLMGEAPRPVLDAAALCQRIEYRVFSMPAGPSDALTALAAESGRFTHVRCEPCELCDAFPLPSPLALVGIDCGATAPDPARRYARVRTASFMGKLLIDRIRQHEKLAPPGRGEAVARISVADYVERLRDRLPLKMKGRDFLSYFGETGDPLTSIDPGHTYGIRSRTEHHIYEGARTAQFLEKLARFARLGDRRAALRAGELMYASHWSYSQRCGLGSVAGERLVTELRRSGEAAGILGAKLGGRACGGLVVVLIDDTARAREAVVEACRRYEAHTGLHSTLIDGASASAAPATILD